MTRFPAVVFRIASANAGGFIALDTKIGKSAINLGIGHGINNYSPGFTLKAVIDLEFD